MISKVKGADVFKQDSMWRTPEILLVEDDKDIRSVFEQILHLEGYNVRTAANGMDAFELLSNNDLPDLIITDLMMPEMNGFELIRAIGESERIRVVPIAVYSCSKMIKDHPDLKGCVAFFSKPFEIDVIYDVINKIVSR